MATRNRSSEVRQQQIIDAVRKLIIKYGSEHLTVRKIATEVGFSEAAIYRHFKSKKEILFFLTEHISQSLIDDIDKAKTLSNGTSLDTIDRILKSHLSAIKQKKGVSFQIIAEIISLGDKKLNKKVSDTIDNYIDRLHRILSDGVVSGMVREDIDLKASATLLFGMIQGLVNMWALSNYNFNIQQKYESLWSVFREAVIKR